ncbi:hypothetical protein BCR35DRAFT_298962 [Leucosporidium creatinivorum]|uniref:Ethanolamine utilization protein n=1 Tax=Leucosporidium creatinivorum TaxID=106004 RepID=A0A1Y2G4H3_9BASI|nr:hypothetical protein BCR35DRAFT_298962 [Leucosporidium creatinivorum]
MTLEVVKNAAQNTKLTELGNGSAIDDVYSIGEGPSSISGGIFTVNKADAPFVYKYKYDELKIILEGTISLKDTATGVEITGQTGDVIKIPKGTEVSFSSPDFGRAFYVGQRALRDF